MQPSLCQFQLGVLVVEWLPNLFALFQTEQKQRRRTIPGPAGGLMQAIS